MGIRIGWQGRLVAGAFALVAAMAGIQALQDSRWLLALAAWPVAAALGWLAILGFPNALLPKRFREAEDILAVPLTDAPGGGSMRWVVAFGQGMLLLLGLGLAALFAFAPVEYLLDYFGGRRGLSRALLDSEGGIVAARIFVTALGLYVAGFCAKSLWDDFGGG
jgi:hypothetical protein